jgi:hypothetical protein
VQLSENVELTKGKSSYYVSQSGALKIATVRKVRIIALENEICVLIKRDTYKET